MQGSLLTGILIIRPKTIKQGRRQAVQSCKLAAAVLKC